MYPLLSRRIGTGAPGMQTQCWSPLTGKSLHSPVRRGGGTHTEYYISATGWRDSWTAFNIMQWPCHCRLHQPLEQIICLIHETGLCWDYSAAVEGIKWQRNHWSHPFSSSHASPLHNPPPPPTKSLQYVHICLGTSGLPKSRKAACDHSLPELICSLPHSSGPHWRSAEAEGCPFLDASPQGCYGTSKAAAPPAWWCLPPGSWFDWPRGIPPLPADASLPEDGETRRNGFQMLLRPCWTNQPVILGRKSELLHYKTINIKTIHSRRGRSSEHPS